mmetsp:Transcript_12944/g.21013  ORF Transcript_12944/g.21013 Transcript_12944/m.21013 type:complete len:209 (+) Transcript_12944:244-870(+)
MTLEERLQVLLLVFQEINFLLSLPLIDGTTLLFSALNGITLIFELHDPRFSFSLLLLLLRNHRFRLSFSLLRLKLLPGSEGHTALIQCLISSNRHPDLITHTQKQQAPFGTIYGDLPDKFIEALRIQLFSDWTNSSFSRLSLHQTLVKSFLQLNDVESCCRLIADVLDVMLVFLDPFAWWKQSMKHVICVRLRLRRWQLHLAPELRLQ